MRINHETLLKVARETVSQRTRSDRGLMAVYLCGSLLEDDYLLGGTADIDLVFIHNDVVPAEREVVHLTDDVHLDIAHHLHKDYRQARGLRVHPWLGPTLYTCTILYDPQHLLDFIQATVRGQFSRSDYVMQRAGKQAEHARQMWVSFHEEKPDPGPKEIAIYLRAIEHAINAVALLSGAPLTERRFLLKLPERAQAVGRPGLYPGLLGLLGGTQLDPAVMKGWLPTWHAAYGALPSSAEPSRLHPVRRSYYERAIQSMIEAGQAQNALWPLLRTWTSIANQLPAESEVQNGWQDAFQALGLLGASFLDRVEAMDAYLDQVEEILDQWARANGALA